jgi:hypothetical protein
MRLFGLTALGARVIIAPNAPVPQEIAHPNLFVRKPVPPVDPDEIDTRKPGVVARLGGTDLQAGAAAAGIGKITAWRAGVLQALPISVFVSKAEGKVYVRHGFRRLFEAPVEIADADRPIGTHVYTALEFKDDGTSMRWIGVSVPPSSGEAAQSRKVSRASRSESEPLLPRSSSCPRRRATASRRCSRPA